MNPEKTLKHTAAMFLALGDGTRLRLLNLMRDREVCVSYFTEVLRQSQPKISRHLAYLRNAGLVEARRDGKWMHYGISNELDERSRLLLHELFKWMADQGSLQDDRDKYLAEYAEAEHQHLHDAPLPTELGKRKPRRVPRTRLEPAYEFQPEPEPEPERYAEPHHNELEDFLL